jgi:MFS family permease
MVRKELLLVSSLLISSFIWYYAVRGLLAEMTTSLARDASNLVNGAFFAAIILSSLLGAILSGRVSRIQVLRLWLSLGCLASLMPLVFSSFSTVNLSIISLFFGLSFGIGMPSCLAFFADSTNYENRGSISGVAFLATNLGAFVFIFLNGNMVATLVVSFALRIAGLCVLLFLKPISSGLDEAKKSHSLRWLLQDRAFLLYVLPWLTFCLVDRFELAYFKIFFTQDFFDFMGLIEPLVGTIFVLLGGILADRMGRKRVLIYGFVALGIGYASIGLGPYMSFPRYFYTFVDGIAWGVFMVIYMLILWGDLSSSNGAVELYYTLGSIPFFLSDLVVLFFSSYMQGIPDEGAYAIFSLASFFLFLAVIPLMFAPETLPEKKIKDRELKQYIEKAKKTKEKYT